MCVYNRFPDMHNEQQQQQQTRWVGLTSRGRGRFQVTLKKIIRDERLRGPAAYLIGGAGEKWGLLRPSRVRSTPSLFAYNCCRLLQLLFLLLFAFVLHFCFYCCLLHWLSDFAFILPYLTSFSLPTTS